MGKIFAGGHLRYLHGEWRDDNGDAVEIARVKHGRWIGTHDGWYYSYSCSECGADALTEEETMHDQVCSNYCPNCGARMDLKGETADE